MFFCSISCVAISDDGRSVKVDAKSGESGSFKFDSICGPETTQSEIFQMAGLPIAESAMQGYNATIFCYGQTGSGKTHTMMGSLDLESAQAGLVPRVLSYLFAQNAHCDAFECSVSLLQIYKEKLSVSVITLNLPLCWFEGHLTLYFFFAGPFVDSPRGQ